MSGMSTTFLGGIGVAALLAAATPADNVIPRPSGGPSLIDPADNPVEFKGYDGAGVARFDGRFVLSGYFTYGCAFDWDGAPVTEQDLVVRIVPDSELAKRLPRWSNSGDMVIEVLRPEKLRPSIATAEHVKALISGEVADVHGHIAVVVDGFAADFGCDYSPYYSARFVAVAEAPKAAPVQPVPNGC